MTQTPNEITDCALLGCLCKCHVEEEENPGPHIATCFWSDPEFPRPTGLVVLEGGKTVPHVVGSWEGAAGPEDNRKMLHGPTPLRGTEIGRLVGFERGTDPADRRCPWMKIASETHAVRCMRTDRHETSNDPAEADAHDFKGSDLFERVALPALTLTTKYRGAWDPREQPGARIELTEEQVRDFTGQTAADAAAAKLTLPASLCGGITAVDLPAFEQAAAPFVDARLRPWFLTVTGRQFFYDDPESYPYSIGEIAHALSNLCRFAGHLAGFYSVAEHSVLVSRALGIEAWQTLKFPGDLNPLLRAALIHDASEAFLMDLPRPLKRLPGLEGYRVLEDRVQLAIERRFGLEGHHDAKAIKRADAAVLVAEKRQLRPPHLFGERGDICEGVEPADVTCRGLAPRLAREFFLETWHALGGQ